LDAIESRLNKIEKQLGYVRDIYPIEVVYKHIADTVMDVRAE